MNIRQILNTTLGLSFGGQRDIYEATGWCKNPTYNTYFNYYNRGLGGTIVDLMPSQCFSQFPNITINDEVDTEVTKLFKDKIFANLLKVDKYSGIHNYSVLFLGFNDNKSFDKPVERASELLYTAPFLESQCNIAKFDGDNSSVNFGKPELYNINFCDNSSKIVHYSRLLHVAENPISVEYLGQPRLERVLNNLYNIDKILSASSEVYWKNAVNGMAFVSDGDSDFSEDDQQKISDQLDDYEHGLSRFLKLQGLDVKNLANTPTSPTEYLEVELILICSILGIPKRLLIGSENGSLASTNDAINWENKVQNRRDQYITPFMLQPLLTKLINTGVISQKDYQIGWQFTNNLSETEQVKNNLIRANILDKLLKLENNILSEDEIKQLIK